MLAGIFLAGGFGSQAGKLANMTETQQNIVKNLFVAGRVLVTMKKITASTNTAA
ncbi:MAG: hypothetical protein ABSG02_00410 [Terriglobales bacterium]